MQIHVYTLSLNLPFNNAELVRRMAEERERLATKEKTNQEVCNLSNSRMLAA